MGMHRLSLQSRLRRCSTLPQMLPEGKGADCARCCRRVTHRMMYWKSESSPLAPTTHTSFTCTDREANRD